MSAMNLARAPLRETRAREAEQPFAATDLHGQHADEREQTRRGPIEVDDRGSPPSNFVAGVLTDGHQSRTSPRTR
jgi:hypothetical protein